jgi:hypothetical protein
MPNGRNVEKLTDALIQASREWSLDHSQTFDFLNLGMVMTLAEHLARRGVLVPSLTDDQLLACDVDQESRQFPTDRAEVAATVRARLERFARGEL